MNCPVCSLPECWHDDGECPDYRRAAAILFGAPEEPRDLREFHEPQTHFGIKQLGSSQWAIIKSQVNEYGRRVNELLDVRKTRTELEPLIEQYRPFGTILP